jgi:ribose transport system permease protein
MSLPVSRGGAWAGTRRAPLTHALAQNIGLVLVAILLAACLIAYCTIFYVAQDRFPGGFELTSTVNNAMPLALASLAQTVVVVTRGIDLSVGGVIDLTNALAAVTLDGPPLILAFWTVAILAVGALCGFLNGVLVAVGRLQPILVTLATLSIYQGLAIRVLPQPGGAIPPGFTAIFANTDYPVSLIFVPVIGLLWSALRRTRLGVAIYAVGNDAAAAGSYGISVRRTIVLAYTIRRRRPAARGERDRGRRHHRRHLHADLDRRCGARRRQPVRRARQRHWRSAGRVRDGDDRQHPVLLAHRSAVPDVLRRPVPARRGGVGEPDRPSGAAARMSGAGVIGRLLTRERRRVLYAFAAAIVLFVIGNVLRPGFASPEGIRSILVVASFVGIVAAGQTFVILIGGIDLSVPWVLNAGAILMVTTSLGQNANALPALAATLGMGLAVGAVNGAGIAVIGIPAVVMTLAMDGILQGLTLGLSGGMTCANCSAYAPPIVQAAVHANVLGVPIVLWLWLAVIVAISFVLAMTRFGRSTYATGNNARASYLAGVDVTATTIALYALSGFFSALAGIMLVGFGGQAALGMGDPYLFQSIAAVVIGGVYILGGRGSYVGTVAGAISLVVLVSVLLTLNMPDYGRSIIYGVVILALLLLYGREDER